VKRFLCCGLLLTLILVLFSCASNSEVKTNNNDISTDTNYSSDETTAGRKPLTIPIINYEGYEFTVLSFDKKDFGKWGQYLDFGWSEDFAGELINDAVYARNMIVEERYNVTIKNIENTDPYTTARKSLTAGDTEYDVISPYIDRIITLSQENLMKDFYTMPYIDLEQEWWDQAILRDLSLNKKIYVMMGDITLGDEELNYAIFYNKKLIEEYKLDNPYQLVRENKWTLAAISEMGRVITHDLNGDGIMGEEDVYGVLSDYGSAPVWYFAFGERMSIINSSGAPELCMNGLRTVTVMQKMSEFLCDKQIVVNASDIPSQWVGLDKMLMEERGLFRAASVYDITIYRAMINDFGVLPFPKFDETQEVYTNEIATWAACGIGVPYNNLDFERTGLILEALAYESKETVLKAYYDINLYTKVARDVESEEMFNIIFDSKCYDLCFTFDWGGLVGVLRNAAKDGSRYMSLYDAAESRALTEMQKAYEYFLD